MSELHRLCDSWLRDSITPALVGSIRRRLEAGESPEKVLAHCRRYGATRNTMIGRALEAEIEAVALEIRMRAN